MIYSFKNIMMYIYIYIYIKYNDIYPTTYCYRVMKNYVGKVTGGISQPIVYIYIYSVGTMERTFKQRTYAHKLLFSNRKYSNNTTLSAYIWKLKDRNITPSIIWEVIKSAPVYNKISQRCLLRCQEKVAIITHPLKNTLLNYNISKC